MASCLLAGSRRADYILLRSLCANRTPSSIATSVSRQDATRHGKDRSLSTSAMRSNYNFDTHHFVQRLEREGLTRSQAEGVMNSMAEVIDESIRTMTRNMVTKSEQEKVSNEQGTGHVSAWIAPQANSCSIGCLYPESRLWATQDGTTAHGTKRFGDAEGGE